jgi:hypothetical protein
MRVWLRRWVWVILGLAVDGLWPSHFWLLPHGASTACRRGALPLCLLSLTGASASLCATALWYCCTAAAAGPRSAPQFKALHAHVSLPPRRITCGSAQPSPAHPVSPPLSAMTSGSLLCFSGGRAPSPCLPVARPHPAFTLVVPRSNFGVFPHRRLIRPSSAVVS